MTDAVAVTQQRVQRILSDFLGSVRVLPDGGIIIQNESAGIVVQVQEFMEHTVVKVFSPMLREVPLTDDLCRWVAIQGQDRWFSHARLFPSEDGRTCEVILEQDLLGDTIDPDELKVAVTSVAVGANDLDDELQQRFGGLRWIDEDS